ncbi:hypothetical protein MRX96_005283 [Rhipicephalus microplus]
MGRSMRLSCCVAEAWRQVCPLEIASCIAHAGFSRAPASIEEDIGVESSGCNELSSEVRKATGCVSDIEDGEIAFEEYALFEADIPVTASSVGLPHLSLLLRQLLRCQCHSLLVCNQPHLVLCSLSLCRRRLLARKQQSGRSENDDLLHG